MTSDASDPAGGMLPREVTVDFTAIRQNLATVTAEHAIAPRIASIGANARGHGLVEVARTVQAAGIEVLAVPDLSEARLLREAAVTGPILIWLCADDDLDSLTGLDLIPAICSVSLFDRALSIGLRQLHLVPAVGGALLGIPLTEWSRVCERAAMEPGLEIVGVMADLLPSDRDGHRRFAAAVAAARAAGLDPRYVHSGDAALDRGDESVALSTRIGAALFGLSDTVDLPGDLEATRLRPAMTVSACVINVKKSAAGAGVSYGYTYVTTAETFLALVPLGYADGVDRAFGNIAPVVIAGGRFTIAGRVAMDAFVVDVGDHPVHTGDRAVLFGDPATGAPDIREWASALGVSTSEIASRMSQRIPRRFR